MNKFNSVGTRDVCCTLNSWDVDWMFFANTASRFIPMIFASRTNIENSSNWFMLDTKSSNIDTALSVFLIESVGKPIWNTLEAIPHSLQAINEKKFSKRVACGNAKLRLDMSWVDSIARTSVVPGVSGINSGRRSTRIKHVRMGSNALMRLGSSAYALGIFNHEDWDKRLDGIVSLIVLFELWGKAPSNENALFRGKHF